MNIKRFEFQIASDTIVGNLHLPEGHAPFPALVVAGPMTSVKEQVSGVYAAGLAQRGYAAMAIDHRHFGESSGEPRGYEAWRRKVEDLRAAVQWLSEHGAVDAGRIAGVGVCLGCGYLAHAAAAFPSIRALGLVAGYYRDPSAIRAAEGDAFDHRVEQGIQARLAYEATGLVLTIPAAATVGDAAMATPEIVDYYTRRAAHPNYLNSFALMSREHFLEFDVQAAASNIAVPTLMLHSQSAISPHLARSFSERLGGKRSVEWWASRGQTDFYDDPILVGHAADRLAMFFGDVFGSVRTTHR